MSSSTGRRARISISAEDFNLVVGRVTPCAPSSVCKPAAGRGLPALLFSDATFLPCTEIKQVRRQRQFKRPGSEIFNTVVIPVIFGLELTISCHWCGNKCKHCFLI